MGATFVSYGTGTCQACGGAIKRGDACQWGNGRGARIHDACSGKAAVAAAEKIVSRKRPDLSGLDGEKRAAVAAIAAGTNNIRVPSLAGTGKTTLIEAAVYEVPTADYPVAYLVFNKKNADEAEDKMPDHVTVGTWHRFTLRALTARFGRLTVKDNKVRKLLDSMVQLGQVSDIEVAALGSDILSLVGKAKHAGIGALVRDTRDAWMDLVDHYDIDFDVDPETFPDLANGKGLERGVEIARALLVANNKQTSLIDFDDMPYFVVLFGVTMPQFGYVFVDEAQDTDAVQMAVLRMMIRDGGHVCIVGDPGQALYGFRGADSDAMDKLAAEFNTTDLRLTTNYRCSRAVIELAQTYMPDIKARPGAPDGEVLHLDEFNMENFEKTDAVLCRFNAPLVALFYRMVTRGIPCLFMGRDLAGSLKALVRKITGKNDDMTLDELESHLDAYLDREVAKLTAKGEDGKAEGLRDRVAALQAAIDSLSGDSPTVNDLLTHLDLLFGGTPKDAEKKDRVVLSTIHKAKGLEWPRVFLVNFEKVGKPATREWMERARQNQSYVGVTRARETLVFVDANAIQ